MPPFFHTSRRALWLDTELNVAIELTLSCLAFPFKRSWFLGSSEPREVGIDVEDKSRPESRSTACFFTCLRVLRRWGGGAPTKMASTTVETVDFVEMPEDRRTSMLVDASEVDVLEGLT